MKLSGKTPDMFLDNSPGKWETTVTHGCLCREPASVLDMPDLLVIVAIQNNPDIIKQELLDKGFKNVILMSEIEDSLKSNIAHLIDENMDLLLYMAMTGHGTDKSLDAGVLPVSTHFYQPIPDLKELHRRDIWSKVSPIEGLRWNSDKFLANLAEIAQHQPTDAWPRTQTGDPMDFHLDNNCFSFMCASLLYGMVRKNKPGRIIEVGSGNSSKVIRKALTDSGSTANYKIIDPYCAFTEEQFAPVSAEILRVPVEETALSMFAELQAGDILFIDSSHVVRIGGDVNFEILEVLPILNKGVIVHFHDIEMPFEYSKIYATREKGRFFWTESYMLQAFLAFNDQFEILLPAAYLCRTQLDAVRTRYPQMQQPRDWSSGSFWIRRN